MSEKEPSSVGDIIERLHNESLRRSYIARVKELEAETDHYCNHTYYLQLEGFKAHNRLYGERAKGIKPEEFRRHMNAVIIEEGKQALREQAEIDQRQREKEEKNTPVDEKQSPKPISFEQLQRKHYHQWEAFFRQKQRAYDKFWVEKNQQLQKTFGDSELPKDVKDKVYEEWRNLTTQWDGKSEAAKAISQNQLNELNQVQDNDQKSISTEKGIDPRRAAFRQRMKDVDEENSKRNDLEYD